jgi:hypothetical protein
MPDLSPELNLALAVDDDDTADYLDGPSQSLRESLLILDGLFNATTGHAHNGSHQGGALEFLDLTVGEDLNVVGASDLHGSVHAYLNLTVDGNTTLTTLSTTGLATLQSLDVTTTTRLRGGVGTDGALTVGAVAGAGSLTVNGDGRFNGPLSVTNGITVAATNPNVPLTVTGNASVSGTLTTTSLATTNLSSTDWLRFTATNVGIFSTPLNNGVQLTSGGPVIYPSGDVIVGRTAIETLSNKTLADPKLSGQVTIGGSAYTFPTVVGNAGMWRYVKAWSQNMTINLTNGTFILGTVQYSSGQYILLNGDSLSVYCDGSNWWVL